MNRRDFLKKALAAGAFTGMAFQVGGATRFLFNTTKNPAVPYDLVGVKGADHINDIEPLYKRAIKAMGGMDKYVKPGQKVVVKPNIGWDVTPEKAANTNPNLVKAIVKDVFDAGASEVYVFDHTCDNWNKCYNTSGIESAAKDEGAKVIPANTEGYYEDVDVNGKRLKEAKMHEKILESDVFINVPKLKHHNSTRLTISMKNLMGIVWDRHWWHRNDLHQCIADFSTVRKPDLNIVDAFTVMLQNGPRGVSINDVSTQRYLIMSDDMVAADTAATKIMKKQPSNINYIRYGDEMNIGEMHLDQLNVGRFSVNG